jgi:glycerophosphoryl diester phosphodiesterase
VAPPWATYPITRRTAAGEEVVELGDYREALGFRFPFRVTRAAGGVTNVFETRAVAALPAAETGLMRVDELLADLPPRIAVNVDVKSALEDALRPRAETTAARVADLVADAGRTVLVTSFDPAALLIVRERAPELPLGLLTWTRFPLRKAVAAAAHLGLEVVTANVESFGDDAERAVRVAHEAGLEVGAWCPLEDERARLLELGVDCLVIDLEDDGGPSSPPASPAA